MFCPLTTITDKVRKCSTSCAWHYQGKCAVAIGAEALDGIATTLEITGIIKAKMASIDIQEIYPGTEPPAEECDRASLPL